MLYDNNSASLLIGSLLNATSLVLSDKYNLNKDDFTPNRFHRIVFCTIKELVLQGIKDIEDMQVLEFLKAYPKQYDVVKKNNISDFINTVKKLSSDENIDYYYQIVKKFSLLRAYKEQGFEIKPLYDEDGNEEEQRQKLNQMLLEDISNYFEGKLAKISKQFNTTKRLEEYQAGLNFAENKERFKKEPLVGNSFQSPYLNAIFRGLYGFVLRSGNSGSGKTTMSVGDLCKMCVKEYYDKELGWVKNKSRCGAGLFINSEMSLEDELEPIFIAWIADVPRSHIVDGEYDDGEEDRVDRAGKILVDSEIYLVDNPNFTIKSLTSTIEDYALNKNIKACCFDYVANNTFIQAEVSSKTKVPQREDMILLAETDALKQISRKTGVNILSGTQLNAQDRDINVVNESLLMGGKGQVRKCDAAMIMMPPTKKELELTKGYARHKGFGENIQPNFVAHIVKGRANKYGKNIKVFQYIDLSTARSIDLFCTDKDNNLIKVDKFIIEKG